jgi:hypothetical protein
MNNVTLKQAVADCLAQDNTFGPWAGSSCRGGFDFTRLFEESVLSVALLSAFICLLPFRWLFILHTRHDKYPRPRRLQHIKEASPESCVSLKARH